MSFTCHSSTAGGHVPRVLLFLATLFLLLSVGISSAQIQVELTIKRRTHLLYEPVLANVSIRNLTGRDLELYDSDARSWFGFEIMRMGGRTGVVSPINPNYRLSPVLIPNGQTVKRTINIRELYQIQELGMYSVKANVFLVDSGKIVSSRPAQLDITDGKVIFRQTVGIPPDTGRRGTERTFSLLSYTMPKGSRLYARIIDPNLGTIYCTHSLGRLLSFDTPKVVFDSGNEFHILQTIAPKTYYYTHLGLDGEVILRQTYYTLDKPPKLRKLADGTIQVVGGILSVPEVQQPGVPGLSPQNISERPAGLPPN